MQIELSNLKLEFASFMTNPENSDLISDYIRIPASIKFTSTEKIMLFLLYCQTPGNEIAIILGITDDNYRSKKRYLKQKLNNHKPNNDDINVLLACF